MANEQTKLKKGRAQFAFIGKFAKSKYTFDLEKVSDSGWHYNRALMAIDCGEGNVVYAEAMGGFGEDRENKVYVHGKKMNDNGKEVDDWGTRFEIDWDDRFNPIVLNTIGEQCFIKIGIERDVSGNLVTKKFLSQYDAIQYLSDNLEENAIVNVKGNLKYSVYNDEIQIKKEITSVYLSKVEKEEDFKAEFTQTILLDKHSVGKIDMENSMIPIKARVLDYDKTVKCNIPYEIEFELPFTEENKENIQLMATRLYKAKKDINELEIIGKFVETAQMVSIESIDISDDLKWLIEIGVKKEEEVLKKAVGNTKKVRRLVIKGPGVKNIEKDGEAQTVLAIELEKYKEEDFDIPDAVVSEKEEIQEASADGIDGMLNGIGL